MKIKTFQARTFSEALGLVRKELGDDAVILSSEERQTPRRCVEVTAAVDYDMAASARPSAGKQISVTPPPAAEPAPSGVTPSPSAEEMTDVRRELSVLRETLEEIRAEGYVVSAPSGRQQLFHLLRKCSIRGDLAMKLTQQAAGPDDLPGLVAGGITVAEQKKGRRVAVFIGPTGVGKTTTIAKLAAREIREGRRAAIVNLDTYRIGAIEQMRIYARVMGLPLAVASSAAELRTAIDKFADRDVVFVDTTGRNPRDEAYIGGLSQLYRLGVAFETHLLVSANSDSDFLADAYRRYRALPVDCIGFTKLDEAVRLGAIYNLATYSGKPVAYVTNGQRVPQDIAFPDSAGLADMILKNEVA